MVDKRAQSTYDALDMPLTRQHLTYARSPKHGGANAPWTSRDYDLPIVPCLVSTCAANKASFCGMASLIDIGGDGRCKTGARFIAATPKVTKSPFPY